MYQQATHASRRSSSPTSHHVWSHNTGYTGAAGIHSEVGYGAHARSQRMVKHTSNVMTAEEDLMRKEMRALNASRKSLESSMLLYSQKMRDISDRKTQPRKSPIPFQNAKHRRSFDKSQRKLSSNGKLSPLQGSVPNALEHNETLESSRSDYSFPSDTLSRTSNRKQDSSRMSVDSGISMDSHRESLKIPHETCISEEDNLNRTLPLEENPNCNNGMLNTEIHKDGANQRGRLRHRKRFCDSKTSKFVSVPSDDKKDNEDDEKEEKIAEDDEDIVTPRIAPFPYDLFNGDYSISPWVLESIVESEDLMDNRVLDSMQEKSSRRGGMNLSKSKTRTPYVLFRPKPAQSPSLAALRNRFFRRFGPRSIYFRYSEEVLSALRSLSNSPERRKSSKSSQSLSPSRSLSPSKKSLYPFSPPSSPTLLGLDLEELLTAHSSRSGGLARLFMDEEELHEFFLTKELPKLPQLSRERSFSAPSSKGTHHHSFVSKLDQVIENDDSKLKPVLKKDQSPSPLSPDKKNVQFFLPDIFKQTNMCTSQGPDYS